MAISTRFPTTVALLSCLEVDQGWVYIDSGRALKVPWCLLEAVVEGERLFQLLVVVPIDSAALPYRRALPAIDEPQSFHWYFTLAGYRVAHTDAIEFSVGCTWYVCTLYFRELSRVRASIDPICAAIRDPATYVPPVDGPLTAAEVQAAARQLPVIPWPSSED